MSVKCQARDCTHNTQGSCFAGAISVQGSHAHSTSQTCCQMYNNATSFDSEFASEFGTSNHQTRTHDITCHASNCKHNSNFQCVADSIQINSNTATCETFQD